MQVLTVIIPYSRTTSNIASSCRALRDWLSNNGFPIKTKKGDLGLGNVLFYESLDYPGIDEWIRIELFNVIKSDKTDDLRILLKSKVNVEMRDSDGDTILIWAACWGSFGCLQMLIKQGADINAKNKYNHTALCRAAVNDKTECVQLLLEHKADPEIKNFNGRTVLSLAVMNGHVDSLKLLLKYEVDLEATNIYGTTALSTALSHHKPECVRILLAHGAKVSPEMRANFPQYFIL